MDRDTAENIMYQKTEVASCVTLFQSTKPESQSPEGQRVALVELPVHPTLGTVRTTVSGRPKDSSRVGLEPAQGVRQDSLRAGPLR